MLLLYEVLLLGRGRGLYRCCRGLYRYCRKLSTAAAAAGCCCCRLRTTQLRTTFPGFVVTSWFERKRKSRYRYTMTDSSPRNVYAGLEIPLLVCCGVRVPDSIYSSSRTSAVQSVCRVASSSSSGLVLCKWCFPKSKQIDVAQVRRNKKQTRANNNVD